MNQARYELSPEEARKLKISLGLAQEIGQEHDVEVDINIRVLPREPYSGERAASKEMFRKQIESKLNYRANTVIAKKLKETIIKMLTDE